MSRPLKLKAWPSQAWPSLLRASLAKLGLAWALENLLGDFGLELSRILEVLKSRTLTL